MSTRRKLTAVFLSLVLLACQKEKSEDQSPPTQETGCTLAKTYVYDFGVLEDSIQYTYTNNKVSKVLIGQDYYLTFKYKDGKVVRRDYFSVSTNLSEDYDSIVYNPDGTITKIQLYTKENGQYKEDYLHEFSYKVGKLSRLVFSSEQMPFDIYDYTWTGNNLTKVDHTYDPTGTAMHYITEFKYDNLKNAFNSNQQALLLDGVFIDDMGSYIPFCISANNPTEVHYENDSDQFSYVRDAKENITEFKLNGVLFTKSVYNCK